MRKGNCEKVMEKKFKCRVVTGVLLSPVILSDEAGVYEQADRHVTADVWQEIKDAIDQVVDNITLAELVRRYHEKGNCEYYI